MSREKNLYRRSGVWWLRATVNGVEQRESLRTGDVRIARARRDKRLDEIKAARWDGVKRITWKDAVTAWAEHVAGQIAPSTALPYGVSLLQVEPFLAPHDIDKIEGKTTVALIAARKAAGATPATIRRDLTAISASSNTPRRWNGVKATQRCRSADSSRSGETRSSCPSAPTWRQ